MPSAVQPKGLPDDVSAAVELFGNKVRVKILQTLRVHGPATCAELCRAMGTSHPLTLDHLARLEAADLVYPEASDTLVAGKIRTRWALREEPLVAMALTVAQFLTGLALVEAVLGFDPSAREMSELNV